MRLRTAAARGSRSLLRSLGLLDTIADGETIVWNADEAAFEAGAGSGGGGGGSTTLDSLTDVAVPAPSDGDTLVYDADSGLWVPGASASAPTAAADGRWFEVFGNDAVVADGSTDTVPFSTATPYDSGGNSVEEAPTWLTIGENGGLVFEEGVYSLALVVQFADAAGGYREALIDQPHWGSTLVGRWAPIGAALKAPLSTTIVVDEGNAGEEWNVKAFQNSGDDLNIGVNDGYVRKIG